MKAVMHDSSLRDGSLCACLIGLPHVHADCLDLAPLLVGQGFPQSVGSFSRTVRGHFQNTRMIDVCHHTHVILTCAEALLIDANVPDFVETSTVQSTLYCSLHDHLRCRPVDTKQKCCCLNTLSRMEHIDGKGLEQESEATVFLRPGN